MRPSARLFMRTQRPQCRSIRPITIPLRPSSTTTFEETIPVLQYRRFGHLHAQLDPLGLNSSAGEVGNLQSLAVEQLGSDVAAKLEAMYCGKIGAEFEHAETAEERLWWATSIETSFPAVCTPSERRNVLNTLVKAEAFELFLGKKFPAFKRYSGEGSEGALVVAEALFAAAARHNVGDIVIGEAHRGRLAFLCTVLDYQARKILWKIAGNDDIPWGVQGGDDVSSHAYVSVLKSYPSSSGSSSSSVRVSLLPNPSHLEAVNPVAAGKVRAKRDSGSSPNALCLLLHGDAACSGQGVVAECYAMANLPGYSVGGTVHVVVNNQVGYTAEGTGTHGAGRSSRYASDFAKSIGAPVLHVNGEAVPELLLASRLAMAYRMKFGKDVVLDIIGYRRHGHNEVDEPAFTQPRMYGAIRARPTFAASYASALIAAGELTQESLEGSHRRVALHLEAEMAASKSFTAESGSMGVGVHGSNSQQEGQHVVRDGTAFGGLWAGMRQASAEDMTAQSITGVNIATLRHVATSSVTVPPGFTVHDRLVRGHVKPRLEMDSADACGPCVDWSTGEALAFGSMLLDGHPVRISGQDVERGTFSQRHAVLVDQGTGERYTPLAHMALPSGMKGGGDRAFYPTSSLLSEMAVMGFELGYSWDSPKPFIAWEAQFGDFANGAQIIIDQFLSGSESKWLRQTGLTLLLPHGYLGAGPEHSSGRIERFLQLVNSQAWSGGKQQSGADKSAFEALNMSVVAPTTAANYFHVLRRQVARPFRKPLVVFTPTALLRASASHSSLADCGPGTSFQPVLHDVWPAGADTATVEGEQPFVFRSDDAGTASRVHRVLLCSGKVYHELGRKRASLVAAGGVARDRASRTAILRVEELAPWPAPTLLAWLSSYTHLEHVAWVQEEPANAGAYTWAVVHMRTVLEQLARGRGGLPQGQHLPYVGRPALPTPAVGMSKRNKAQQDALLEAAFAA